MTPDLVTTRDAVRAGTTSPAAEMDKALAAARSPACRNAFLHTRFDEAAAQARAPGLAQLPLAGLAVSVKDLFDVAGHPTAAGSVALDAAPGAAADSTAVARLQAAGGIVVGRTNMSEFAFSGVGINPHFGTPANPADPSVPRIPGGSSSGAAVSVAAGAAFIGLGSDTGGSIRIPAALCGIVGFKNTARLTPLAGALPLSSTLDTVCAMTRSVGDAIVAHEVLSDQAVERTGKPLSGHRLAVARTTMLDGLDATVAAAFERSLKVLRGAGAHVEEIALEELNDLGPIQAAGSFAGAESYTWHRSLLQREGHRYDPRVRLRIERGEAMRAHEYLELVRARHDWIARVSSALEGFHAVLSPTVPLVAPPIAQVEPGAERDDEFFRVNGLLLRNTAVVNMLDGCALSLPCHAPGELPVGLMLWQGALHDDAILNLALAAESALAGSARA